MVNFTKYAKTAHLPWSPGITRDDRIIPTTKYLDSRTCIITPKMDGECTTLYRHGLHARSLDYAPHPSRDWVRNLHAQIAHEIPEGWRICGENLFARHSISYKQLESYFLVFSIWTDENWCLSWGETQEYAEILGLKMVATAAKYRPDYTGFSEKIADSWLEKAREATEEEECEGYVIRVSGGFDFSDFGTHIAKYVRESHVQTTHNWMFQQITKNRLK